MDSKTEPASEAKERIESEAITYVKQFNWRPSYQDVDSRKDYIAGATAEYNRAQEEITSLKAELERKNDAFRDGWIAKHKSLTEELERERELRKEILKGLQRLDRLYYAGYTIYPNDLKPLIEKSKDL